jgi:hypothetical protein
MKIVTFICLTAFFFFPFSFLSLQFAVNLNSKKSNYLSADREAHNQNVTEWYTPKKLRLKTNPIKIKNETIPN